MQLCHDGLRRFEMGLEVLELNSKRGRPYVQDNCTVCLPREIDSEPRVWHKRLPFMSIDYLEREQIRKGVGSPALFVSTV